MLECEKLGISFGEKTAVKDFFLSLREGESVGITGANGSGKSSLALLFAGIIPELIEARVEGKFSCKAKTGLIMQNPSSQFFALTVKEETGRADLGDFRAQHLLRKSVFELSEGEKQKINLISNLLNESELLILDEPLELLDPFEARAFKELLEEQNKTVIWFDKDESFLKGMKTFSLGNPVENHEIRKRDSAEEAENRERRKGNSAEKIPQKNFFRTVLDANFSLKLSGLSLQNLSFSLAEGEKVALIGANGSGKTSFLKSLAGLHKVRGKIFSSLPLNLVPQNPAHIFFRETALQEICSPETAEFLGMNEFSSCAPEKLSKGQQKLLSLASFPEKSVMLLDEPTTWLDSGNKSRVYDLIEGSPNSMLVATHDKRLAELCDRVLLLNGGLSECSSSTLNRFFRGIPLN